MGYELKAKAELTRLQVDLVKNVPTKHFSPRQKTFAKCVDLPLMLPLFVNCVKQLIRLLLIQIFQNLVFIQCRAFIAKK
jgi:hypothetical protein